MKRFRTIIGGLMISLITLTVIPIGGLSASTDPSYPESIFAFQAIDTMKYSRDLAREKLNSVSFDEIIEQQVASIAATGATHVAIATPYDSEFLPFLYRWVASARKHNLKVWFRGNWSGWEGWFEYAKITRDQHLENTRQFILANTDLFADGDVFSACPECENGGPGDPRQNGDIAGHRQFIIDEYAITKQSFQEINKRVASNFISMNADVARLLMDKETTTALDGLVTIDHYVKTPKELNQDITDLANQSGGKVVLGEWGMPIPDIHGDQSESNQSDWIDQTLKLLAKNKALYGLSYWVNVGGSTSLWDSSGQPRSAVEVLTDWYRPRIVSGTVKNQQGQPIVGVSVGSAYSEALTDEQGYYSLPLSVRGDKKLTFSISDYKVKSINVAIKDTSINVSLVKEKKGFFYRLLQWLTSLNPWR